LVVGLTLLAGMPAAAQQVPDLSGTWTNGTLTPFERPANLADKAFLTEEEAAAIETQAAARRANPTRRPGDVGGDNEAFVDSGYKVLPSRQTSLVVDPPDGRIRRCCCRPATTTATRLCRRRPTSRSSPK
jgi:hypothetical protein